MKHKLEQCIKKGADYKNRYRSRSDFKGVEGSRMRSKCLRKVLNRGQFQMGYNSELLLYVSLFQGTVIQQGLQGKKPYVPETCNRIAFYRYMAIR